MPLSATDLATLGGTPITILSTFFAKVYLRMDGTGVTTGTDNGSGKVNCQYTARPWENFKVHAQTDGSYSFESAAFPNVYLRMDGTGVPTTGAGGGTVNCQFGPPGPYEKFKVRAQADGSVSFESTAFPNIFLRLIGSGVTTFTGTGGGLVNCQLNANGGGNESFFLNLGA